MSNMETGRWLIIKLSPVLEGRKVEVADIGPIYGRVVATISASPTAAVEAQVVLRSLKRLCGSLYTAAREVRWAPGGTFCSKCNFDEHICGGCGGHLGHGDRCHDQSCVANE